MFLGVLLLVSSFYSLALYAVPCDLCVHVHFLLFLLKLRADYQRMEVSFDHGFSELQSISREQ
jgi:hypothetical protein